ncbi:MAG: J domain-containing protein [Chitinophagaceae bacterium]|nr:J domain-containing protein [Chitinophagaceae bacterium]
MKDYYAILEIPVTASIPEIKQAYRRLVMIYHPDKNNDDPYSLTKFNEIKEAYEILINPGKKELYLQERWSSKAKGRKPGEKMITPPNVLIQILELNKAVADMDIHRMDHRGVADKIKQLLNQDVIDRLLAFNEAEVNQSIVHSLIHAIQSLPLKQIKEITNHLSPLLAKDEAGRKKINQLILLKQKQQQQDRLQPVAIFILVVAICALIWFTGKH